MYLAQTIAQWSRDKSTKVGCVITRDRKILTSGYNGFPRGVNDNVPGRYERPDKYVWTEHAERNAMYNAARDGTRLEGATLYVTCTPKLFPCSDCARGMIQSGIKRVVCDPPDYDHPKWGESFRQASSMLVEAGVSIYYG